MVESAARAAALSDGKTEITNGMLSFVPGGCDLTGSLEGRPNGWPGWVGSFAKGEEREAKIKTAGYFDVKNFARRIKCLED